MSARGEPDLHVRSASRRERGARFPRTAWRPRLAWPERLRAKLQPLDQRLELERLRTKLQPLDQLVGERAADAFIELAVRQSSPLYQGVRIERRNLAFHDIHPLSRYIAPSRTHVASIYVALMLERDLTLFEPMCLRRPGEKRYQVSLPPVVEPWSNSYVLIDGVHRLCALGALRGRHVLVASLVSDDDLPPLPGRPANWEDILVEHRPIQRRRKFERLRPRLFRPAASYLRSESLSFTSLSAIGTACDHALAVRGAPVSQFWCPKHRKLDDCVVADAAPVRLRHDAEVAAH